jgi:hypothetical protein
MSEANVNLLVRQADAAAEAPAGPSGGCRKGTEVT